MAHCTGCALLVVAALLSVSAAQQWQGEQQQQWRGQQQELEAEEQQQQQQQQQQQWRRQGVQLDREAEPEWQGGPRAEDLWPTRGASNPLSPPVTIDDGVLTGTVRPRHIAVPGGRSSFAFEGIPFAKPPVGELRFMPPEKNAPYGELNATYGPPACAQAGLMERGCSEDCLYLNVYTPTLPNATHSPTMPVMVFIYGGAFTTGGTTLYFPDRLQQHNDVVVVVIQYRLGLIGFFTTLTDAAPGNQGMLDQVMALRWVQHNIAAFGGDPDSVTIFGESAGGASVSLLLLSPLATGLFHRAIAESGTAIVDWAFNEDPLLTGLEMAESAGCPTQPEDVLLECLRNLTSKELVQVATDFVASERNVARNGFDGLNPVIQPDSIDASVRFLPKNPLTILEEGSFTKVPTIVGCNKNEGSFVFGLMYNDYLKKNNLIDDEDFLKNECVGKMLEAFHIADPTDGVVKSMMDQYFFYVDDWKMHSINPALQDLTGLFGMKAGAKKTAELMAAAGSPTWLYSFEHRGQHTMATFLFFGPDKRPPFDTGVTHADELLYLFPIPLLATLNAEDTQVSDAMVAMWTNFAAGGDPTPAGSPLVHWPQVSEHGAYLQIDRAPQVKHDYSQTFDITVQDFINSTVTTPAPGSSSAAPSSTPSPAPSSSAAPSSSPAPSSTVVPDCAGQVDQLTGERDRFREATIGLAAVAAVAALLLAAAGLLVTRARRRAAVTATVNTQEKPEL